MTHLKCSRTPAGFGELVWNTPDDVVEVTPDDATALLAIADAGFSEVLPSEKTPRKRTKRADVEPAVVPDLTEDVPAVHDASA